MEDGGGYWNKEGSRMVTIRRLLTTRRKRWNLIVGAALKPDS